MNNSDEKKLKKSIMVVDDDILAINKIKEMLAAHKIDVMGFKSAVEALYHLENSKAHYPVIVLDYILPDMSGDDLTRKVKSLRPESFIFTQTGVASSIENAVNSIKNGADNFFQKSENSENFEETILDAINEYEGTRASLHNENLQKEAIENNIVTNSDKMRLLIAKAIQSSKNKYNVLLTGETGTGKEKIARLISNKYGGSFYPINCSQFYGSDNLLESELFGHEKGAFTDAKETKKGIFEVASGGVVFLDEIDRMGLSAQAKLLRAIQEKKIKRVGGIREISVDIKLIASSKPNIKELRDSGKFLADLYGRLNVIRLDIPPLRDRLDDIEILLSYFAKSHIDDVGEVKTFDKLAINLLKSYHWPENVRELENFYIRLATHIDSQIIKRRDLILHLEEFKKLSLKSIDSFSLILSDNDEFSYRSIKDRLERMILSTSLQKYGSISETARQLKMNKSTLHAKLKQFDLLDNTF